MITNQEIQELKYAVQNGTTDQLIKKWENKIFQSEINKAGNRAVTLKNQQNSVTKTIIGKEVAQNFVMHKDAWGGSFYVLTHIETGVKVLSGKKSKLSSIIKDFIKWEGLQKLNEAITKHGLDALKYLDQQTVNEYRVFYTNGMND